MNRQCFFVIFVLLLIIFFGLSERYVLEPFFFRRHIPKILHKTGPFPKSQLTPDIQQLLKETIDKNPGFQLKYYDDKKCREIIGKNFRNEILHAYDALKPGAYKADLFRYCILYLHGGIYSDLTQVFELSFSEIIDFKKDVLVLVEDKNFVKCKKPGIQINFIVARPRLGIFLDAINKIAENVKYKNYGNCSLEPTGPILFRNVFEVSNLKDKARIPFLQITEPSRVISKDTGKVFFNNKSRNHDENINKKKSTAYNVLWNDRDIYHEASQSNWLL